MNLNQNQSGFRQEIEDFIKAGFSPHFGRLKGRFNQNPFWHQLRQTGTQLWLDTGSIEDAQQLWTQEFSALTTNNTLLNKEVQTGRYDSLISEAAKILAAYPKLTEHDRMLEMAFVLNAYHALRLVEKFDAYVSVEEHTALAHDVEQTVNFARRFYAICPERFIIKIPFTPAGLLATRRVSSEHIPVNHTLGFSARQNYVIARIGRPAYVNVFLGRLNSFVADNNLGDGSYVGEKATIASQVAVRKLRRKNLTTSQQIGASFRSANQILNLAGLDVLTMPPKVASDFLSTNVAAEQITDRTGMNYHVGLNQDIDPELIRLNTLWDIGEEVFACVNALEKEDLNSFTPNDLVDFFREHNCSDMMVQWLDSEIATSSAEGKIPQLNNWREALADKSIGLDSLMNLAGLNSFATDQKAMDERVQRVLAGGNIK